jgi:hypothetical protein
MSKAATVGIIFSESEKFSNESRNMAFYLTGLLSSSGYAKIFLFGQTPDSMPGDISNKRITYCDRKNKIVEVPVRRNGEFVTNTL